MPVVTLYRRRHCGLCDDALVALRELARGQRFQIVARGIDGDPGLRARYDEIIPVIAIGDTELARAPIDLDQLAEAIRAALRDSAS